jgi:transcriptional regulator with XRE-family HTH domain
MSRPNSKFKVLLLRKIKANGYKSIRDFSDKKSISRSPITKTIRGISTPERSSVQRWCDALNCSPQERNEIFQSVYVPDDELEEESNRAA